MCSHYFEVYVMFLFLSLELDFTQLITLVTNLMLNLLFHQQVMSLFSEGITTYPDNVIVIILILSMITSLILNPMVFLYHCLKPNSIPKLLFQVLAIVDFFTCICFPVNGIVVVAARGNPKCQYGADNVTFRCTEKSSNETTFFDKLQGYVHLILVLTPSLISSILAIFRYLQIKRPFQHFRRRQAIGFVGANMFYLLVIAAPIFFHKHTRYYYSLLTTWNPYFLKPEHAHNTSATVYDSKAMILISFPILTCQSISVMVSFLTISHLKNCSKLAVVSPADTKNKKQSYKVMIINILGLLGMFLPSLTTLFVNIRNHKKVNLESSQVDNYLVFTASNIIPVIISVLNPMIFIIMTPGINKVFVRTSTVIRSSITGNIRVIPFFYST